MIDQSPTEPGIRTARSADAPAIHELIDEVLGEYQLALDFEGLDKHLREPASYFSKRGGVFWILSRGDRLMGTVGSLPEGVSADELKSLYIRATDRRRGWGRRLVEHVLDHTRQSGKSKVVLWSDTRFLDAHRLYQKVGFIRLGQRDCFDKYQTREFRFEIGL